MAKDDGTGTIRKVRQNLQVEDYIGKFLAFGTDWEELAEGVGNYPIVLVGKDDGTVASVSTEMICFPEGWPNGE